MIIRNKITHIQKRWAVDLSLGIVAHFFFYFFSDFFLSLGKES
nr:MAG TPA: hypothetical protein [Caudoviricetes sp.]